MTLNEWQVHLEQHFATLQRQPDRNKHALFALENGMSESDREDLSHAIRYHIAQTGPSDRHWLVWVVYATEIGYDFSGDEYWQTFSDRTPGWSKHEDRDWVRDAFRKFHRRFGGAKPCGRWAEHFSIISWPITHAIIPKDLQRQLAEVLYDIRGYFDTEILNSPQMLGERVEAYSWRTSSRFQDLAEQHLLVGQIASSLLLNENEDSSSLILPATRQRIATDLDLERRSREWLSDAREHATAVKLKGLRKGSAPGDELDEDEKSTQIGDDENNTKRELRELGIEPRIFLRPFPNGSWDVRLRIPNLSPLLSKFPNFKEILVGQRCSVAGARDRRPLARGRVLYSAQDVSLAQWPKTGQVLLKFDDSAPELDYLLHTECLLRPGPTWVFRCASDGSAVEHLTKVLRPGNDYVVLSADCRNGIGLAPKPVTLTCAGIHAIRISVPDTISEYYSQKISDLGLTTSRAIRVWPAGLVPPVWDGEGCCEWLTTDRPCVGVAIDFPLDGLVLSLSGPQPARMVVPQSEISNPLFICLGELAQGKHTLSLFEASEERAIIGTLNLRTRPPRPTRRFTEFTSPLQIIVTPANPALEQLWEGRVVVEILGPDCHDVEVQLRMYRDRNCSSLLAEGRFGPIKLPVSSKTFFDTFKTAVQTQHMQNAYDEASACILKIRSTELGQHEVRCEREFVPVRWVLRYKNHSYFLRIVQLDAELPVTVSYLSYDHPDRLESLCEAQFLTGFRVPDNGGLYLGRSGDDQCSIVIPPRIHSLNDLNLANTSVRTLRSENHLEHLFVMYESWSNSRLPGDLFAKLRKQRVLAALRNAIIVLLCGDEWAAIERTLSENRDLIETFRERVSISPKEKYLLGLLAARSDDFTWLPITGAARLLSRTLHSYVELPAIQLGHDHGMSGYQWITEFALRTFRVTEGVREWAADEFSLGLCYLLRQRLLARTARLVTLMQPSTENGGQEGQ
jgi:hypothetical protein